MPTVKDLMDDLNNKLHVLEGAVRDNASGPLADAIGGIKGRVQSVAQHVDAGVKLVDLKMSEFLHFAADHGQKPGDGDYSLEQSRQAGG